jgi:dTDP-4-dehydrorhamnose reductase
MIAKILIIGANGMLGGSMIRYLSKIDGLEVLGTVRSNDSVQALASQGINNLQDNIDVTQFYSISTVIGEFRPDYVINCIGVIKQVQKSSSPVNSIELNSLFPHRLALECEKVGSRLVHFSTDCVFSGAKGKYLESDLPDALDLYGRSKLLGEVNYNNHITLRTSIIGHELGKSVSLVDWFLGQKDSVYGYTQAIFSGMPTVFVAEFLCNYVFGKNLKGLYHLSVDPIDKYQLLTLVRKVYDKEIEIHPSDEVKIDRSLCSTKLCDLTGFKPPSWGTLINKMHNEYLEYFNK